MTAIQIETQLIVSFVAIACAIPGTFLVLRKMALISDAISHSILPGFVLGFFVSNSANSPLLLLFGALTGLLTVVLVEQIQKTKLVKEDTAIGLVFPALFSIGVILVTKKAAGIHLDIDNVLVGNLAAAPLDYFIVNGVYLGSISLWVIGITMIVTIGLSVAFFKELKITTFDIGLASSLGFSPILIHYGLMTVSSFTIVGSFNAVGAILVIALLIIPAATAYMLTNDLKKMIFIAILFGVFSSISGFWLATLLDTPFAGAMTSVLGLLFLVVYFFAPERGLISVFIRNNKQGVEVLLLSVLSNMKVNQTVTETELFLNVKLGKVKIKDIVALGLLNQLIKTNFDKIEITHKGVDFRDKFSDYLVKNDKTILDDIDVDLSLIQ